MKSDNGTAGRLTNLIGIVLILVLSLVLLGYVGYGEAYRTYPKFEVDRLAAQGEVVKNSMQSFLQAGLPLEQFPGFTTLSRPLLDSDKSLAAILVADQKGQTLFAGLQTGGSEDAFARAGAFRPSALQDAKSRYQVTENADFFRVSVDLNNKFERVGTLLVYMPKAVVAQEITQNFLPVEIGALVILAIYAVAAFAIISRSQQHSTRWLGVAYAVSFVLMSGLVIRALLGIYSDGIQDKTRALANSLGQRLDAPIALGLDLNDLSGLDQVFADYKRLYPELSFIALTLNDQTVLTTDATSAEGTWKPYPNTIEFTVPLDASAGANNTTVHFGVHVGVPESVIYEKLWRGAKNFVVLFVAVGFLSLLFFNLLRAITNRTRIGSLHGPSLQSFQLDVIQPVYFLAVFAEALAVSFLPQHLQGLAKQQSLDPGVASTLFTVYFAVYGLCLLPASRFAERSGAAIKQLIVAGIVITALVLLLMATVNNIYAMYAIRAVAGLGQGLILVGVQAYILEVAAAGKQTQGAAILVFGYNSGMISGTAVGGLLAVYMGTQGVFITGAVLALLLLAYAGLLVPRVQVRSRALEKWGAAQANSDTFTGDKRGFWNEAGRALRDFGFVKAVLLIGIPTKAIMTGITIFALPLLLSRQSFAQEDIGQVIMFYSAGVLISSTYIARIVDRVGRTTGVLFFGTLAAGLGLILIGMMGWDSIAHSAIPNLGTYILLVGMSVLGIAHGFITAPIITHVANSRAALSLGKNSTTSLYRFLERAGHIGGPVVVGALLAANNNSFTTLGWIGAFVALFGLLFVFSPGRRAVQPLEASA